ncbi:hypothetical protein PQR71_39800 [Paraburkholderia fungorum]|uniref:hypothetical protein n=1 Tax=Paraburkholderia fungorum TaxID=134537 RepID=UPI0038BC256B
MNAQDLIDASVQARAIKFVESHGFRAVALNSRTLLCEENYGGEGPMGVNWTVVPCTPIAVRDWLGY